MDNDKHSRGREHTPTRQHEHRHGDLKHWHEHNE